MKLIFPLLPTKPVSLFTMDSIQDSAVEHLVSGAIIAPNTPEPATTPVRNNSEVCAPDTPRVSRKRGGSFDEAPPSPMLFKAPAVINKRIRVAAEDYIAPCPPHADHANALVDDKGAAFCKCKYQQTIDEMVQSLCPCGFLELPPMPSAGSSADVAAWLTACGVTDLVRLAVNQMVPGLAKGELATERLALLQLSLDRLTESKYPLPEIDDTCREINAAIAKMDLSSIPLNMDNLRAQAAAIAATASSVDPLIMECAIMHGLPGLLEHLARTDMETRIRNLSDISPEDIAERIDSADGAITPEEARERIFADLAEDIKHNRALEWRLAARNTPIGNAKLFALDALHRLARASGDKTAVDICDLISHHKALSVCVVGDEIFPVDLLMFENAFRGCGELEYDDACI